MGWALIIHPFHPSFNQRFPIIKVRCLSNQEYFTLRGGVAGTFSVPKKWTDQDKSIQPFEYGTPPLLDIHSLLELRKELDLLKKKMVSVK
ncbi:DUF5372 family protein [Deltaproteobacteria bacterium TL4]